MQKSVTYILTDDNADCCVLIDCGDYELLKARLTKPVKAVMLTHGHFDHIAGLNKLLDDYPALEIYASADSHQALIDSKRNLSLYHGTPYILDEYTPVVVFKGEQVHFEGIGTFEVISTAGHTPGSVSYLIGNHLFTGDAYLPGQKTFTKFPGGDKLKAEHSRALLTKLETEGYTIHCGHHSYIKASL